MIRPVGARPAPGTTDLLEVLDRALGGGIVIASGSAAPVPGLAPVTAARIYVAAFETYLQHTAPDLPEHSAAPLIELRRSS